MSYLVLARKYRPQTFEEVISQTHVTQTLSNAVLSNRVAHAIIFAGPRGTGKTSVARILAKVMNCEKNKEKPNPLPCNECNSCKEITYGNAVDVFEIDGASNNSVDQIRELRENVKYMPAHSLYKIYIIDEVHMLSMAAFNALLKTLEEPPAHIMFIFATTEPHKIPITILSRCQRYDFRRIGLQSLANHMKSICDKESIKINDDSINIIAQEAGGSMRDSLSLLDQILSCSGKEIDHEHILNILGVVDRTLIFEISKAVIQGDIKKTLDIIDEVYTRGHDIKKLYSDIIAQFRNMLIVKMAPNSSKLVDLPDHEIELIKNLNQNISEIFLSQILDMLFKEEPRIKLSEQPKLALEMAFIKILHIKSALSLDTIIEKINGLKNNFLNGSLNTYYDNNNQDQIDYTPADYTQIDYNQVSQKPCDTIQNEITPEIQQTKETSIESKDQSLDNSALDNSDRPLDYSEQKAIELPIDDKKQLGYIWEQLLKILKKEHPALASCLLKSTLKKISDKSIEIQVISNAFNISRIENEKAKNSIKKIINKFFNKNLKLIINTQLEKDNITENNHNQAESKKENARNHPLISDVIEVFGGKVVDIKIL